MIEALGEYAGVDRRLWPVESSGVAARLMLSAAWGNPPYPLGWQRSIVPRHSRGFYAGYG